MSIAEFIRESVLRPRLKQAGALVVYDADNRPFYARVSPDAVLAVTGNLVIALIVVKYEQTGVISSQVRNFIKKI